MLPFSQQSHIATTVLTVTVVAFALGEFSQSLRPRRGAHVSNLIGELVFRVVFFAGILALPASWKIAPWAVIPGGAIAFAIGTLVAWGGLLLRWWCFVVLGRYFTAVVKATADQELVDRGPYSILRHPSYTGLLVAIAGGGVMLGNWVGATGAVALVLAALVYRIRIEERALTAAMGAPYSAFAKTRARMFPFVW
jgi:protein-S-isoprenylcysteine O-methyltransferase Ste14